MRPLLLLAPVAAAVVACACMLVAVGMRRAGLAEKWGAGVYFVLGALALGLIVATTLTIVRALGWWRGTWQPDSLAPLRMAFVCVVLGWLAYVTCFQPFWMLSIGVTMSIALGAFALGWLLAPLVLARLPRRAVRAADFALFQLCVLVVLAELVVGLYSRHSGARFLDLGRLAAAEELALWRMQPGELRMGFPVNSSGDYDHEPSSPPREHPLVVCIGDSFSAGIVPHHAHFTTVAEERLSGVEIYNMGAPVIGPREYLYLLREEALELEPDLIVINLFVGNDIEQESFYERSGRRLRRWFTRDELALHLVATRLGRMRAEERRQPPGAGPVGAGPGSRELAGAGPLGRAEIEARLPWLSDPLLERGTFSEAGFEAIELQRARAIGGTELDYGPCFARLEEILASAGEIPVAVLLIPDEFQVEDELWQRLLVLAQGEPLERDRAQRKLTAWCAARGVPVLDLLPALRAVEPLSDGRKHLYHLRDTHFNSRGNRVAGEALADFLAGLVGTR